MQMKKILGILLAFCFVMSVTAAAASAQSFEKNDKKFNDHQKKFNDHQKKFNDHQKKVKHFHPGHWDKHKVAHKKFINHKVVIVYVVEKFFVPGYWH